MKYVLRIGLGLLVATLLTNALIGQYVNLALDTAFTAMFSVGPYIALAFTAYVFGVGAWLYWKQSRTNVPNKAHKAKVPSQAFLRS